MAPRHDPWEQLGDLDGREKYRVLEVPHTATDEEIKQAYRRLARRHHPDKGGDATAFAKIQASFETLSSRSARHVYDDCAGHVQYRHRPSHRHAGGGEDILLEELASAGVLCDPFTQLVVLCEVCGRPSNKECWTCKMPICSFCTLKRHWKEGFALHWPLINSSHMETQLANREFEKKRVEDARMLDMEDPNWRSEAQLIDMRAFKAAALEMQRREDRLIVYDYALARYYMWAQTDEHIHIAVHIPSGFEDSEMQIECTDQILKVQVEGSPAVIERLLHDSVDTAKGLESFRTKDNRSVAISLKKQNRGVEWPKLFQGDSDGVRCMQPPYRLTETVKDVTLEVDLPFLFQSEDIRVDIGKDSLQIEVEDYSSCRRFYWQPRDEKERTMFQAVNCGASMWCLDEGLSLEGRRKKTLQILLVRPEPNEEEVTWKKGMRQDNLNAKRPGGTKGYRFFQDDEDEYGLEDILQAMCWRETGKTWVPGKAWIEGSHNWEVIDRRKLSKEVQGILTVLLEEGESISTEAMLLQH